MSLENGIRIVADLMEVAARTAPKAVGKDFIEVKILTDEEKEKLIKELQAKTDDPDVKAEIRKLVENGEWDKL